MAAVATWKAVIFVIISIINVKNADIILSLAIIAEKISPQAKALAMLMYGSGKASSGMIAHIFKVSRSTVLYWIRNVGLTLPEPIIDAAIAEVSIDESGISSTKKTKNWHRERNIQLELNKITQMSGITWEEWPAKQK